MVSFQLIRISSYAKNKLQMCWVTQHCRSRQMWKIFTNIQYTHFLSRYRQAVFEWREELMAEAFNCSNVLLPKNHLDCDSVTTHDVRNDSNRRDTHAHHKCLCSWFVLLSILQENHPLFLGLCRVIQLAWRCTTGGLFVFIVLNI